MQIIHNVRWNVTAQQKQHEKVREIEPAQRRKTLYDISYSQSSANFETDTTDSVHQSDPHQSTIYSVNH